MSLYTMPRTERERLRANGYPAYLASYIWVHTVDQYATLCELSGFPISNEQRV